LVKPREIHAAKPWQSSQCFLNTGFVTIVLWDRKYLARFALDWSAVTADDKVMP